MTSMKPISIIKFKCPDCKQYFNIGQAQLDNLSVVQCHHCQAVLRLQGKNKCIIEASASTLV
jgi:hypothetical protein